MDSTGNARPFDYGAVCNLVTKHALGVLRAKVQNLDHHLKEIKEGAVRCDLYPDGTLLIEGGGSFDKLRNFIINQQLLASGGVWDSRGFLSLDPFPCKAYALWYTTDYRESLGELSFSVIFPSLHTYPTKDYRVEDLQITVVFRKRASAQVRKRFAACLSGWFKSVANRGMFGEGPIRSASNELRFRGRLVQFRLDASQSGQDTLNWLLLSVLNFGYEVSAVQRFIFDQETQLGIFVDSIDDSTLPEIYNLNQ